MTSEIVACSSAALTKHPGNPYYEKVGKVARAKFNNLQSAFRVGIPHPPPISWYYQAYVNGQQIDPRSARTKDRKKAQLELDKLIGKRARGEITGSNRDNITVGDLLREIHGLRGRSTRLRSDSTVGRRSAYTPTPHFQTSRIELDDSGPPELPKEP
jgi:hypothetical protein